VHLEEPVLHGVDRGVGRGHLVEDRIGQVAADQAVDGTVERGREQQGLVGPLEAAEHPLDLGHEAHVGHAVGLVEDQVSMSATDSSPRSPRSMRRPGVAMITSTPAELLDLALDVGAAVDGDDPEAGLAWPAAPGPR
jgi:hypothetical protein